MGVAVFFVPAFGENSLGWGMSKKKSGGLLASMGVVGGGTLLSRALGFSRDLILANKLGAGSAADAFWIALTLPNLLRRLFAEGAFNVAFVPLFSRAQKDTAKAESLSGEVLSLLALVTCIVVVLAELFMPALVSVLAPGFRADPAKFELTVAVARLTFPYLALITLASYLGALCNAYQKFTWYAVAPALLNIALISCVLGGTAMGLAPAWAAAWGVPLGGVLQLGFMVLGVRQLPINLWWRKPTARTEIKQLLQRMGPAVLSVGVLQISVIVDNALASLTDPHAVSYLQYANRFYQLPLALLGVAMATVLLTHLSQAMRQGQMARAAHLYSQGLVLGGTLGLAAAAGLYFLAEPLLGTFFEHGAFTRMATFASSSAMMAYALGLPGYILAKVTATVFYAAEDTKTPFKIAAIALALNVVANLILMQWLGFIGIALGTALSGWAHGLLQLYWVQKRGLLQVSWPEIQRQLGKALLLALLMGLALQGFGRLWWVPDNTLLALVWIGIAVGGAGVFCAIGALALGLVDTSLIKRFVKR